MTRKNELFELGADEPEMLYAILCKLPKPLDIEDLVSRTTSLFHNHPPESLPWAAWKHVSSFSVLKTTRDAATLTKQTLEEGEALLKKHADQIEREEARKRMVAKARLLAFRYRRPATAVSLAVFVGVLSFWLGKNGQVTGLQAIVTNSGQSCVDLISYTLAFLRG